jgi:putative two-component system hydrogenase maturation factor HypX/HoxX
VASLRGSAGAGGVILALGADQVVARDGVVLNPHYRTMGLYGSEYWTYVLPRRVGLAAALDLTGECLPIGAAAASSLGLVDAVYAGPPAAFDDRVLAHAHELAATADRRRLLDGKRAARAADEQRKPLDAHRAEELAEMSRDIFDDRHGFASARRAFVTKQKPDATPPRLARHRQAQASLPDPVALVAS